MLFIDNKYTHWYYGIISNAKSRNITTKKQATASLGYVERHHVIPKCMAGTNQPDNLVYLTGHEHFVCHLLLIRMVQSEFKSKLVYAAWQQSRPSTYKPVRITGRTYEYLRKQLSLSYTGRTLKESTKEKLSMVRKGKPGHKHTLEHKAYMSALYKGVPKSYSSFGGKQHSIETKDLQSKLKQGEANPMFGRAQTEETKRLISAAHKGKQVIKITCPHCARIVAGQSNFNRWHGENCKLNTA
jgi:hypothetical protein